jgi:hypothetical protein
MFGGAANTPNAVNLNQRFTVSNNSKLRLVVADVDSVQFFTDAATGRSGISQSGLAVLCGVTKQALSKLTKSLSTKCPSIWLKPIQGKVDDLSTRTETGILLYYDQLAIAIIKHYAFSGREQAQLVLDKFALIGFNAWVQRMTGWQEPEKPTLNTDLTCVLDLLEAHTRRSESLNRTIHTAIHQQINAIKDTLKVLEGRIESSTIETIQTTTPQKIGETTKVAVRRIKGEGSGSIHWRTYTRNGRQYRQAFFHYELWEGGDRLIKSCKYIPKGKVAVIQDLQAEKAAIVEILRVLIPNSIEFRADVTIDEIPPNPP